MSEYHMETRRRSRSKTPFLRSSCDHENCEFAGEEGHAHHHHHQQKKKAPNVQTIVEETVEVTSSSSPKKQMETQSTQRTKTSDYSSEDTSPESKSKKSAAETYSSSSTSTTTTTTTVITKDRRVGDLGGAATSTPKASYMQRSFASHFSTAGTEGNTAQRLKEVTQNVLNAEQERSQRSLASNSGIMSRIFGSSTGVDDRSSNGDLSDHIAYMEYKRAGEYWKTTPKTDYTYSELSPYRRQLAPGVVAMPNMSRRSLENHHERINYMIERDPTQEEFIRRRYESSRYVENRKAAEKLAYDSGDEVDYTQFESYRKKQYYYNTQESWFTRIITTIVTTITSAWSAVTGGVGDATTRYNSALYHTKYGRVERGFFGTIGHAISSVFAGLFRYIYLFISSVLCLDTWLLQSSNAENKSKKRFLLFLLMLLPLALLGGLYYYLYPNEPFPPRSFSEVTFTLPEFSKLDMSEYLSQEKYEALKAQAYNRLADFRAWTDDYVLYLRTVSQNIADEGRKYFQREEHFERA